MLRVVTALLLIGAVIYLLIRLFQRGGGKGSGSPGGSGGGNRPPKRPVAPDDDPTFLRDLDDQMWQERRRKADPDQP